MKYLRLLWKAVAPLTPLAAERVNADGEKHSLSLADNLSNTFKGWISSPSAT